MSEKVQLLLGAFVALVFVLSRLARRYPDVVWLRAFRDAFPQPTEAQRKQTAGRTAFLAGAQLILMGICLPLGYIALTAMFFSDFTRTMTALVLGMSVLCIGLGVTAIWQSRRR